MSTIETIGLVAGSAKPCPPLAKDTSGLLQTVQGHVEDIRALIYCGVCVKPLYEPFTLACGHTFCYSCLTQWFVSHRRKKTCPDCRASVSTQPAPAYLIREIVQMFISRAELLENNETTREHLSNKRAETEKIESDKRNSDPFNGGLFQGCFKCPLPFNQPINDIMDGVTRCPRCAWELEEGGCLHCGFAIEGYDSEDISDDDESITMTDAADDIEDGFSAIDADDLAWNELYPELQFQMHHHHHRDVHRHNSDGSSIIYRSTGHSDDEDSHDSEMSDFIDDGPIEEGAETDHSTVIGGNTIISDSDGDMEAPFGTMPIFPTAPRPNVRQTISLDDDDDDDDDDDSDNDGNNYNEEGVEDIDIEEDGDDDDDDDDEPVRAPTRAVQQRRQISTTSIDRASRLQRRAIIASTRTSVSDTDEDECDVHGLSASDIPNCDLQSGSNAHSPISLEDDSDVPVGPVRSRRRGSRSYRTRPSRGRREDQATASTN